MSPARCGTILGVGRKFRMNAASASTVHTIRPQLLERRARVQAAANSISAAYLDDLIGEIDAGLECNPLVRFCLDHLSRAEMAAHQQDLELATQIQAKLLPRRDIAVESWE